MTREERDAIRSLILERERQQQLQRERELLQRQRRAAAIQKAEAALQQQRHAALVSLITQSAEQQPVRGRRRVSDGLEGQPRHIRLRAACERAFRSVGMSLDDQK